MTLRRVTRAKVLGALEAKGTRPAKLAAVAAKISGPVRVASDGTWTIIVTGKRVGVAKRCTYARRADEFDRDTGLAVAASRL